MARTVLIDTVLSPQNENIVPFKENELKDKKPSLQLVGGTDGPDENWLGIMEVGTAFVARKKGDDPKNPFLNQYEVGFKKETCTLLFVNMPDNSTARPWVDNLRFSRAMELVEILGVAREAPAPEIKPETPETTDAGSGSDQV